LRLLLPVVQYSGRPYLAGLVSLLCVLRGPAVREVEDGCTGGGERMLGGEADNLTGGPTTRMLPHVLCRMA
jgi:hypothetical protein